MSDPYRNDLNRPVVVDKEDSGMGVIAGIAVVALLVVGGFLFYTYKGPTTVASTTSPMTTTAPSTTPAPARPAIVPGPSVTPTAPPAPSAQ